MYELLAVTGTVSHFEIARDNWWNKTGMATVDTVPVAASNSYTFKRPDLPPGAPVQIGIRGVSRTGVKGDWKIVEFNTDAVEKCGDYTDMLHYRDHRADYNKITQSIMFNCFVSSNRESCMTKAIISQLGFSSDCAPCHSNMIQCALSNCM